MSRKVLTRKPKEYLQQGWNHCGAYSIKSILEAYGKADEQDLRDYHLNWFGKMTGCTAGGSDYWPKVLEKRGLVTVNGNADSLSDKEKIKSLRSFLDRGVPIMISIGNGYMSDGKFYSFFQKIFGHWITLWGYDDEREEFYVYDSGLASQAHKQTVPIGNTSRSFREIVRDWGKGIFPWPRGCLYITIKS